MRFMLLLMLVGMAHGALANPLRVCVGDVNVWPPFTYWQGSSAQEKAESLTGSATTLVLEALKNKRSNTNCISCHGLGFNKNWRKRQVAVT